MVIEVFSEITCIYSNQILRMRSLKRDKSVECQVEIK